MAYATIEDIQNRMTRPLTETEINVANNLLEDAAVIIDAYNSEAKPENKQVVSCRMIIRQLGDGTGSIPVGASQGSMSGLGYSQSWTYGSGSSGELYLAKVDKITLGVGNKIGSYSPVQELAEVKEDERDDSLPSA